MIKILVIILLALATGFVIYELMTRTAFFPYYKNRGKVRIVENLIYKGESGNPKHRLDLYLPKDKKGFPVVQFVHGGYWKNGDKNYYQWLTGLYANIGFALAKEGIGVVVQNYRLAPGATIGDEISDVADGILWTEEHIADYGGNGSIFLMGHSAGGHLIALLASDKEFYKTKPIDPNPITGYIALSAIWDIKDMVLKNNRQFNEETSYPLFGKEAAEQEKYSPSSYLSNFEEPIFLAVGGKDYPYLQNQADTVKESLLVFGKTFEYVVAPGYTHEDMVIKFGGSNDALTPKIVKFVEKYK